MALTGDAGIGPQARLFRGLSEPSRLALLRSLLSGERTVSEVVAETGLSQPNASWHLAYLRTAGLVSSRPEGRRVYYALADSRVGTLLRDAEELLSPHAGSPPEAAAHAPRGAHG